MAVKTSLTGKVLINSTQIGHLTKWSLKVTVGAGDVTAIGDVYKSEVGLLGNWVATLDFIYDQADAGQTALRGDWPTTPSTSISAIQLWEDGTHYWSGAGLMVDWTQTKTLNATDKITVTVNGFGALSYT